MSSSNDNGCPGCKGDYFPFYIEYIDGPIHRAPCPRASESVKAVKLAAAEDGAPNMNSPVYLDVTINDNHPIFKTNPLPISQTLGFPLVIAKLYTWSLNTTNVHATWLMIDPETGMPPMVWQSGVGDVIIARADKTPMTVPVMKAMTEYLFKIIDVWERTHEARTRVEAFYNPERFKKYLGM